MYSCKMHGCLPITKRTAHCSTLACKVLGHEIALCMFKSVMASYSCQGGILNDGYTITKTMCLQFSIRVYSHQLLFACYCVLNTVQCHTEKETKLMLQINAI